jgi:hypothetical protein
VRWLGWVGCSLRIGCSLRVGVARCASGLLAARRGCLLRVGVACCASGFGVGLRGFLKSLVALRLSYDWPGYGPAVSYSDEPIEVLMLPVMVAELGAGWRPRRARSIDLLAGRKLEYVRLGHAVVLGFSGGHQVLIETVAQLDGPRGRAEVEPGEQPSDVLATLLGDVVRTARTRESGELTIVFGSGSELRVDADADFESWAVAGPDGVLIVCLARGELAFWGDAGAS